MNVQHGCSPWPRDQIDSFHQPGRLTCCEVRRKTWRDRKRWRLGKALFSRQDRSCLIPTWNITKWDVNWAFCSFCYTSFLETTVNNLGISRPCCCLSKTTLWFIDGLTKQTSACVHPQKPISEILKNHQIFREMSFLRQIEVYSVLEKTPLPYHSTQVVGRTDEIAAARHFGAIGGSMRQAQGDDREPGDLSHPAGVKARCQCRKNPWQSA